jgi:ribosomal protein S18 acetylase RimI-like enzyme
MQTEFKPSGPLQIEALPPAGFDAFLDYLNDHLADNGSDGRPYFQPLSRQSSRFPADKAEAFRNGLQTPVSEPGWRRLWVARDGDGRIAGHIDLRAHGERPAAHRCLLGMGVDRDYRRLGLGRRLIAHAAQWAADNGLEWIDLQVLSVNQPAIALYRRAGFIQTGEVADMFRLDGQHFAYTSMALQLIE